MYAGCFRVTTVVTPTRAIVEGQTPVSDRLTDGVLVEARRAVPLPIAS